MKPCSLPVIVFVCAGIFAGGSAGATAGEGAGRPNVIILIQDDMAVGDLSTYGNPVLRPPNSDRLCDQGVSFSQFHVAPMRTPTREMLLTGGHCIRNRAHLVGTDATLLRIDIPTATEIFRAAGVPHRAF